jgi:multiple sugar transport system ATP-binding protein
MTIVVSNDQIVIRSGLQVRGVDKRYDDRLVLNQLNFDVARGELLALTGPSGAGKSTTLRILAGLEESAGTIMIGGRDAGALPPGARHVALMFESYALYPNLSVRQNALSPLEAPGSGRCLDVGANRKLVDDMLSLLEIDYLADRLPGALSGGQKQRVALARTLVQDPSLFLLDEPISHLDAKLRHKLRGEVRRRLSAHGAPSIWATPDGMEALSVGDRVAVIEAGRIEQIGSPEDIWQRPQTIRVAQLLGDPPMNLIPGSLGSERDAVHFAMGQSKIQLPPHLASAASRANARDVTLGVRPDALVLSDDAKIEGDIYANEPFGKYAIVTVALENGLAKIKTSMTEAERVGGGVGEGIGRKVKIAFPTERLILFNTQTGRIIPVSK